MSMALGDEAGPSSPPRAESRTLVDASSPSRQAQDGSSRTDVASRRSSHHADQRMDRRRSRPTSRSSGLTGRSQGGRRTTRRTSNNLTTEEAIPPPVTHHDRRNSLEQAFSHDDAGSRKAKTSGHAWSGWEQSGAGQENELSELAAPKPIARHAQGTAGSSEQDLEGNEQEYADEENEQQYANDEDDGMSPPPFTHRYPDDHRKRKPLPPQAPPRVTQFYTISYLVFFSILGTLARLGVQWITFYPGTPIITPVIWANFAGCVIMGFLSEDKRLFRDEWSSLPNSPSEKAKNANSEALKNIPKIEHSKIKKTIPLYVGLATGFCGSFTSFSSFERDAFLALSNNLPSPYNHPHSSTVHVSNSSTVSRSGGYSLEALLAVIIYTLALSLGGLFSGAHLAIFTEPYIPRISTRFNRLIFDRLVVLLGLGCWLGAALLCIWPPDRPSGPSSSLNETWRGDVLFALVFAPLGCLLRWYASLKLNSLVPSFPLGTFAVNMFGTAVLGMCWDVQHVGIGAMGMVGGGRVSCQVLQGIEDGFCGCLTTVSTWVAEINGLQRKHAYLYALASVSGGFCLLVVIMGSVRWSVGWAEPLCPTGYTNKLS